jgi:hypothetical protein
MICVYGVMYSFTDINNKSNQTVHVFIRYFKNILSLFNCYVVSLCFVTEISFLEYVIGKEGGIWVFCLL